MVVLHQVLEFCIILQVFRCTENPKTSLYFASQIGRSMSLNLLTKQGNESQLLFHLSWYLWVAKQLERQHSHLFVSFLPLRGVDVSDYESYYDILRLIMCRKDMKQVEISNVISSCHVILISKKDGCHMARYLRVWVWVVVLCVISVAWRVGLQVSM